MALHELYVGGPGRPGGTFNRSQFPAPTFNAADPAFQEMVAAVHKGPIGTALTRTLDFGNDHALMEYVANNAIVAADDLHIQVVPAHTLLLGLHVEVETPQAGVSLTFTLSDGTTFGGAIDCSTVSSQFTPPNGLAWVTDGAASLATAEFANVVKMLRADVTALGAGGFGRLRISVSPILMHLKEGQY